MIDFIDTKGKGKGRKCKNGFAVVRPPGHHAERSVAGGERARESEKAKKRTPPPPLS